jgi:hypothetical protein
MMGRQTVDQSQLFYLFNLEKRIPPRHILRRCRRLQRPSRDGAMLSAIWSSRFASIMGDAADLASRRVDRIGCCLLRCMSPLLAWGKKKVFDI